MVEEVIGIIGDIQNLSSADEGLSDGQKQKIGMYLEILRDTLENQSKIVESYEGITKKLEAQINECQDALEDSTQRETEQLQLMMELKEQYDKLGGGADSDDDDDCAHCEQYEQENEVLREQTEQQSQVIEKLSKA